MKFFRRSHFEVFALLMLFGAAGCSGNEFGADQRAKTADEQADEIALAAVAPVTTKDLCDAAKPGFMRCHAKVVTDASGQPITSSIWAGPPANALGPVDIQGAYKLPTTGGAGRTIAIVDAMAAADPEGNLATYRSYYSLPACTKANGCLTVVNQDGQASPLPAVDSGWEGEIMLDLDMASAACPDCKILLIETNSASTDDLGTAVNTAAKMGASAISNSYGGAEDSTVATVSAQYFKHPGILVTVSSGDSGYGVEFPASSEFVMAVGGTNLAKSSSTRGWAEKAWTGAGSGCSKYIAKPSWEKDTGCTKRMESDISAVADPATGVAVYDKAWQTVGGTSAASPIVASIFVLFNLGAADASWAYSNTDKLFDITSGSNAKGTCTSGYQCVSAAGYDGPTGNGTPNGALISGSPPPEGGSSGGTGGSGGAADAGKDVRVDGTTGGTAGAGGSAGAGGTAGSGGTGGNGGTGGGTPDAAGGAAGNGGSTDGGGRGGVAGNGGTAGSSGGSGGATGGTGGSGGSTGGTGGAGGSAGTTGGNAGTTGSGGTSAGRGGSTGGSGGTPPPDPGCGGCAVASSTSRGSYSAGALLLLAATVVVRRRRRA